ncbi:MAG: pyrK [Bacillales bacterium]|jgi:dihydroorotate dehydrogenase electron transfer subunit|nr:pyrK [Bacillales bacterium]
MKTDNSTIIEKQILMDNVVKISFKSNLVDLDMKPGQFVNILIGATGETTLRRPISVYEIDVENKAFTIIFRVEGKGTRILSEKTVGEEVNILGPLGNGFPLDKVQKGQTVMLVGGGIGIPPLYETSKQLKKIGANVIHILGFNTYSESFLIDNFKEISKTFVSTVDGTIGQKGFVTDVIERINLDCDYIFACGPKPMLKALENMVDNSKLYLSFEERMACGIGACYACVCKTKNSETEYKRVCKEGPVFLAGEVI